MGQHLKLTREIKNTENGSETEHAYIQSDSARQPCGPLMSTANNKQPTTSKDQQKRQKQKQESRKEPKTYANIPKITHLCFASIKVLSFSSSCRTRSSVTSHKHALFPITQKLSLVSLQPLKEKSPLSPLASPLSYIYPPVTAQKNIFFFFFYAMLVPPLLQPFVLFIAPTSSLPSLLPIPSGRPEQLTHQLFFLHLPSSLAAQERLILRVARKIIKK